VTWYQHAVAYGEMKWPRLAPHSRASLADALATVTPLLTRETGRRPPGSDTAHRLVRACLQLARAIHALEIHAAQPGWKGFIDRCLSSCAGCPAGTVALGAGGAGTYTERAIPGSEPIRTLALWIWQDPRIKGRARLWSRSSESAWVL